MDAEAIIKALTELSSRYRFVAWVIGCSAVLVAIAAVSVWWRLRPLSQMNDQYAQLNKIQSTMINDVCSEMTRYKTEVDAHKKAIAARENKIAVISDELVKLTTHVEKLNEAIAHLERPRKEEQDVSVNIRSELEDMAKVVKEHRRDVQRFLTAVQEIPGSPTVPSLDDYGTLRALFGSGHAQNERTHVEPLEEEFRRVKEVKRVASKAVKALATRGKNDPPPES